MPSETDAEFLDALEASIPVGAITVMVKRTDYERAYRIVHRYGAVSGKSRRRKVSHLRHLIDQARTRIIERVTQKLSTR